MKPEKLSVTGVSGDNADTPEAEPSQNVTHAGNAPDKRILLSVEAVVIGSGAGGAAVAYELARSGHSVALLEAGSWVPSSRFNENLMDMMGQLYRHHGMETNQEGDLMLWQGHCLGGSTVPSACISERLPDDLLNHWARDLKLERINAYAMQPWFRRVERHLAVHTNAQHELNSNAKKVIAGAEKIGYGWKALSRNVDQCANVGHCLAGCASDRKRSSLVSYIPWAISQGAKVFADTKADRILIEKGRAAGVVGRVIDPASGKVKTHIKISAQTVVLAAGAIQSPLLMMRSGISNPVLGKQLRMQPQVSVLAEFPDRVNAWEGALAGVYLNQFVGGKRSRFLYSAMPAPVSIAMQGSQSNPEQSMRLMKNSSRLAALQCMIQDIGNGVVRHRNGKDYWSWRPDRQDFETLKQAVKNAGDILFAAGAGKVYLPTYQPLVARDPFELDDMLRLQLRWGWVNGIPNGRSLFRMHSMSPQGTVPMGVNPDTSVVNDTGLCHSLDGLFVADASIFPEGTQVPPQLAVSTFATYIADHIKDRAQDYFT